MQRELDQLAPVFEASKTDVQLRQEAVEACQREYAAAKDRCKKQEQDIELMQGPIEVLKKEAQAEFEKVKKRNFIGSTGDQVSYSVTLKQNRRNFLKIPTGRQCYHLSIFKAWPRI